MEKRRFSRIPFRADVTIQWRDLSLAAETTDLSVGGIHVQTPAKIPLNESVDVRIALPQSRPPRSFKATAVVVRNDDRGIGLAFTGMDFDSFFLMAQIVLERLGDRRKAAHEILDFLNCPSGQNQEPSDHISQKDTPAGGTGAL